MHTYHTGGTHSQCTRYTKDTGRKYASVPAASGSPDQIRRKLDAERERERDYTHPALRLIQVLPGHQDWQIPKMKQC